MNKQNKVRGLLVAVLMTVLSLTSVTAVLAQVPAKNTSAAEKRREESANKHINDAAATVGKMTSDATIKNLLSQAKGLLIVPTYSRVAIGVGGSGGAGVLVTRHDDGSWSDPVIFHAGGLSLGAQLGAEIGPIALILNNDKALDSFMKKNNFSISADAGLTIVNWTRLAQGTVGKGDIVAWAGTQGLFGNAASISFNDMRFSSRVNDAYYHAITGTKAILDGKHTNPHSSVLKDALATISKTN